MKSMDIGRFQYLRMGLCCRWRRKGYETFLTRADYNPVYKDYIKESAGGFEFCHFKSAVWHSFLFEGAMTTSLPYYFEFQNYAEI